MSKVLCHSAGNLLIADFLLDEYLLYHVEKENKAHVVYCIVILLKLGEDHHSARCFNIRNQVHDVPETKSYHKLDDKVRIRAMIDPAFLYSVVPKLFLLLQVRS